MRRTIAVILVAVALAGCGGSKPKANPTPTNSGMPMPAATCTPGSGPLVLVAKDTTYDKSCLATAANKAFTITFDNRDAGIQHNMVIFTKDPDQNPSAVMVFRGALVIGPAKATYNVPAQVAGTYHFHCEVHPTAMFGALVVK
jgi:hypothetical protein